MAPNDKYEPDRLLGDGLKILRAELRRLKAQQKLQGLTTQELTCLIRALDALRSIERDRWSAVAMELKKLADHEVEQEAKHE